MRLIVSVDTDDLQDGLAKIALEVPGAGKRLIDIPFRRMAERFGPPQAVQLDLLLIAAVCYAVDKTVSRAAFDDRWTRDLELEIPVSDARLWGGVREPLQRALSFLSGDSWTILFSALEGVRFCKPDTWKPRSTPDALGRVDAVCLFSGGLDSLIGATDLVAQDPQRNLLLFGHYDMPGPKSQQDGLFPRIRQKYKGRVELHQLRISHFPRRAAETTLRCRSLVFMASAMYVASQLGPEVDVFAPENGVIAINVPLTPSRGGSCSTRTMHPYFLRELSAVLSGIGVRNRLHTPFALKTKGECLRDASDPDLTRALGPLSVSCSHPGRRQYWRNKEAANCGYCMPCIFRRAAFHNIGKDDGRQYGMDVCRGHLSIDDTLRSANDLRAMVSFLSRRRSLSDFADAIRDSATIPDLTRHAATVERGFEEVRRLLKDKASVVVRKRLGEAIH